MIKPYYSDGRCELYLGKMEEVLPALGRTFDACVTDCPYGETSLAWDRWVDGWPALVADVTSSMWCFGSMRMFLDHVDEFVNATWKLSQDVVWEKANGTGFATDRFKRVHEAGTHWYRGAWRDVHHDTPRDVYTGPDKHARARTSRTPHTGEIGAYYYQDDGTRLMRSVLRAPSVRNGNHPTEKPAGILQPLIEYAVPVGGLVLDPFAGSGSTLAVAKSIGRRAVGIEGDEKYAEIAAKRLCQDALDFGDAA